MLVDAMQGIFDMIKTLGLYAAPEIGAAPPGNSIGLYFLAGTPGEYHDRTRHDGYLLTVNVKHTDQKTAINAGEKILTRLTARGTAYPPGIDSIRVSTPLSYVDREEQGAYIFTAVYEVFTTTKGR